MFGACVRHFYSGLLGIRPKNYADGYGRVIIEPDLSTCVRRASGSITTAWGKIRVSFDADRGFAEVYAADGIDAVLKVCGREYAVKNSLKVLL